jgi:hypothetical protein
LKKDFRIGSPCDTIWESAALPFCGPVTFNRSDRAVMRDSFRFAPELYEARQDAMQRLADAGYEWLSHYSTVDPLHDVYGLEVFGVRERDDATQILNLLSKMFPTWNPG